LRVLGFIRMRRRPCRLVPLSSLFSDIFSSLAAKARNNSGSLVFIFFFLRSPRAPFFFFLSAVKSSWGCGWGASKYDWFFPERGKMVVCLLLIFKSFPFPPRPVVTTKCGTFSGWKATALLSFFSRPVEVTFRHHSLPPPPPENDRGVEETPFFQRLETTRPLSPS